MGRAGQFKRDASFLLSNDMVFRRYVHRYSIGFDAVFGW